MVFGRAPLGGLYEPVSEETAAGALEAAWAARHPGLRYRAALWCGPVASSESAPFLAGRPRAEVVLLPACQQRGVAVLAAGVFNSGILADPRPGATYDYAPAPGTLLEQAQRIRTVCARHDVPIGAAALHFVLRHPAVTAVVAGARSAAEITEDVRWLTMALPDGLFAELAADGLIPAVGMR